MCLSALVEQDSRLQAHADALQRQHDALKRHCQEIVSLRAGLANERQLIELEYRRQLQSQGKP